MPLGDGIAFGLVLVMVYMVLGGRGRAQYGGDGRVAERRRRRLDPDDVDWIGPAGRFHVDPDRWFATQSSPRERAGRMRPQESVRRVEER